MEKEVYKVLIADDEYWTREKLCSMIDWSRYSLCCMEPAADGEEVLRRIETDEPDILITDINMPFMNGVELLEIIHDKYPDIITFVVSGYDDFQYVKDTLMAGSINYLVKPITRIDLVNALSRALEIISTRKAHARAREEQQIQLLKAASLLQDREFSQLLEREGSSFTPIITINNDMDFAGMSLMLVKIHDMGNLVKRYGHDMNLLSYSVKKEIRRCLKSDAPFVFNHIYRPNEFAIVSELDNRELTDKARYLMVQLKPLLQSTITIMLSGHSYSMDSIHEAYIQDISMLMTRTYTPEDVLLVPGRSGISGGNRNISSRFGDSQVRELKELIRKKNRAAIENLVFQGTGLDCCAQDKWEYLEVKQTVKRILNTFPETLGSSLSAEETAVLEHMIHMSDRTVERLDAGILCDGVRDVIEYCMSVGYEEAVHTVSDIMRRAAAYIDEHYNEDLSLSALAKQFGMESTYFSKTFRQETGENLMLYITRKRMEKADSYIRESEISLTEIAFMVGYDDYAYFSRVFRKYFGRSPRDYRNAVQCPEPSGHTIANSGDIRRD
ncbi:response regulator transcription factor [Enterocloster citroniae]|uniref:response regulator transcription factor n=1 Tax=Enterocloster citroniae TaxID=358743 RepID=UPI0018994427